MHIRPIEMADLSEVARIEAICAPNDTAASLEDFQEFLRDSSEDDHIDILELDGKLIGFTGYSFLAGENVVTFWNLAVLPEHRKTGQGLRLLEHAIAAAKILKAERILLDVAENNTAALALYLKKGFQRRGQTTEFYEDGATALHLELPL